MIKTAKSLIQQNYRNLQGAALHCLNTGTMRTPELCSQHNSEDNSWVLKINQFNIHFIHVCMYINSFIF